MDAAAGGDRPRAEYGRIDRACVLIGAHRAVRAAVPRGASIAAPRIDPAGAVHGERRHAILDSLSAVFLPGDGAGRALDTAAGGDPGGACMAVLALAHSGVFGAVRLEARPDFVEAGDPEDSAGPVSVSEFRRLR